MNPPVLLGAAVHRELLRMALRNSTRTIPLQLVAVAFFVTLGVDGGNFAVAIATAVMGLAVAVWRYSLSRRFADALVLPQEIVFRIERELEGNSALAGVFWAICTVWIYPTLSNTTATVYVVVICGSVATAAFFMGLVGRSFLILAAFQLGSLSAICLLSSKAWSPPLAILAIVFGLFMYRASIEFRNTTSRAIRHAFEADAANQLLKDAKDVAEKANLAKSQFLATMSHEIRTPMNGVLGALDLLRHSTLNADQRRLVRTASSSGTSLMEILNDVLDHSKIEADKLTLASSPMSLQLIVQAVINLFSSAASAKGLSIGFDVEMMKVDWVIGDSHRLKQVLLNLVGNAVKFAEQGRVTLRVFSIGDVSGLAKVGFEVSDTGIGISTESQKGLFQPFHQIAGKSNHRPGGTGLGLAISQRIIEAMGSKIEVDSVLGAGSCFRFVLALPSDESPVHSTPLDSAMGGLDESSSLTGRVLVVEDNDVNRMIARETLLSLGLEVREASDGAQAVKLLEQQTIDLVLMDCQMPVMDGYAATRAIRQRELQLGSRRVPILALTADAFDDDAARSREAGMDAHLAKPYTRDVLEALIKQWL